MSGKGITVKCTKETFKHWKVVPCESFFLAICTWSAILQMHLSPAVQRHPWFGNMCDVPGNCYVTLTKSTPSLLPSERGDGWQVRDGRSNPIREVKLHESPGENPNQCLQENWQRTKLWAFVAFVLLDHQKSSLFLWSERNNTVCRSISALCNSFCNLSLQATEKQDPPPPLFSFWASYYFFFDGAKDDITEYNTTHKVQLIAPKGD